MEADSTTYDSNTKTLVDEPCLPFATCPGNFKLYKDFIHNNGEKCIERQLVERLQEFGLLPSSVKCPTDKPECKVICKTARVIDRVQWACESCNKKQPIRAGSFFYRLQCSIQQSLQIILAWSEDANCHVVAEHFGVKPKTATIIYDRLDEMAIKEYNKCKLGGENSVVLAEMYPDCQNRLSPDTTDQPHVHRILMLADTNHIPTFYKLQVIKEDSKKSSSNNSLDTQILKTEIEETISRSVLAGSTVVMGNNLPIIDGASSIQQLVQFCDADMQHFLTSRIWRQAVTVCGAARELCTSPGLAGLGPGLGPGLACAGLVQRYLHASLYRLRYGDGFYEHVLKLICSEYTVKENTDKLTEVH